MSDDKGLEFYSSEWRKVKDDFAAQNRDKIVKAMASLGLKINILMMWPNQMEIDVNDYASSIETRLVLDGDECGVWLDELHFNTEKISAEMNFESKGGWFAVKLTIDLDDKGLKPVFEDELKYHV